MFQAHISGVRLDKSARNAGRQPTQTHRGQTNTLSDIYLVPPQNSVSSECLTITVSTCMGANLEAGYPIRVSVISPGNEQITIFFQSVKIHKTLCS
jgi:hypothetical protein